jgi:white-opaque regulator 2
LLTFYRIAAQCDEMHPVCRNCQKSKRECLGYDPIFKAQPGPAAIQPAPTSGQMNVPATTSGQNSGYPQTAGYPQSHPGSYVGALSTQASSPSSSAEPYDYASAIDPALEAAAPQPQGTAPPVGFDGTQGFRPDVKREVGGAGSPFSSSAVSDGQNQRGGFPPSNLANAAQS